MHNQQTDPVIAFAAALVHRGLHFSLLIIVTLPWVQSPDSAPQAYSSTQTLCNCVWAERLAKCLACPNHFLSFGNDKSLGCHAIVYCIAVLRSVSCSSCVLACILAAPIDHLKQTEYLAVSVHPYSLYDLCCWIVWLGAACACMSALA